MRYRVGILFLILLTASSAFGQQPSNRQKKRGYVIVPRENILLVIASQPDCPLMIEGAKLLISVDGKTPSLYQYLIRNRSVKPISSYTITVQTSYNTSWSRQRTLDEHLMPGQTFSPIDKDYLAEIVPLTEELRNKLNLRKSMKAIIVLMIESVKFADGSNYSDEKASRALQDYFEDINSEVINSKVIP